jgi:hypothetical protein
VWFRVDGEGGVSDASTTQGDFMAFIGINQQAVGSGVYSAGAQSTARGNGDPYYANVFPAGQTPPAYEQSNYSQQTGSLAVGTVGLAWRDVVINKNGSTVEWFIDGLKIASLSGASLPGSNIFVGYWDPFASVSDNTNLSFGLVDNLRVEVPAAVPIVLVPPTNKTVNLGANATFSVNASGTAPLSYQWKLGATNLLGQTNNSFSLTNIQLAQAGTYSVVVSNIAGSATASASLSVVVVQISSASVAPDGLFHLLASGAPGGGYQVLASTNLANWISLGTFTNSTGTLQFTDPDSANFPARYYRLLAPK